MVRRHEDWLKQGQRDLDHARRALADADYEWSCFAAQQGAEKAVKAVYQFTGAEAWGHSVTALLANLPPPWQPARDLLDFARELDKHYIPTRYPDSHPQGAPYEYYTAGEARRAVENGARIVEFCADILAGSGGGAPGSEAGSSCAG
ncbi:MAG: HEPN domain-containing protein [Dehalococcoidia bacterium]